MLALLPAAGCGSSGSSGDAPATTGPVEVRYRAVASNATFGIVNESHTDRTEMYSKSQPLEHATTKVSPDEVVDAIVDHFRDEGFFEIAQAVAPSEPLPANASQMLEVTTPAASYRAVLRPGVSTDFVAKFQTCAKALRDVYNNTIQLQAVDAAPDWGGGSKSAGKSRDGRSGG